MSEYLSGAVLTGLAVFSVVVLLLSIVVVRWLIVKLPDDYFVNNDRKKIPWVQQHWLLRYIVIFFKNVIGYLMIISGVIMLFLPGQGVLFILFGVMLIDFPGKFHLERWLVRRGPILHLCNRFRSNANKKPFVFHNND